MARHDVLSSRLLYDAGAEWFGGRYPEKKCFLFNLVQGSDKFISFASFDLLGWIGRQTYSLSLCVVQKNQTSQSQPKLCDNNRHCWCPILWLMTRVYSCSSFSVHPPDLHHLSSHPICTTMRRRKMNNNQGNVSQIACRFLWSPELTLSVVIIVEPMTMFLLLRRTKSYLKGLLIF